MANGKWQIANGKLQIANGKWQIANGKWQMANCKLQISNGKWQKAKLEPIPITVGIRANLNQPKPNTVKNLQDYSANYSTFSYARNQSIK